MDLDFRWVMYAIVMPIISLFGLMGNVTAIYVLRYHDIKLKKYLVDVLTALACFDILFLLTSFLLISFPNWGTDGYIRVWPGTVSLQNIFITYFLSPYTTLYQRHGTHIQSLCSSFGHPGKSSWTHLFS